MKKLLSTTIAVGIFAATGLTPAALADVAASALPSLNNATNADVTIGNSNDMNIQIQGGQGGIGSLNWNSYNVGKDASVNYEFTAHNQTALNKVDAAGGLSQIYGKITSSGCAGCGYDATGKVVLINPNGVLFGDGANVNLNSFTVSTFDATYDKDTNTLILNKDGDSKYGVVVQGGANIYGDKAVNLVSDNVTIYNGSKISTNVAPNMNDGTASLGKVKIVTADGVNFVYYNNGAVKNIDGIKASADKMTISLNGDINSGNIDLRNYSSNEESQINLNGATLKAVKAVNGNDGNIWLTALNNVIVAGSKFETANHVAEAADKKGGDVQILAGNKVSVSGSDIDAVGNVSATSNKYDVVIDSTAIDTAKDVTVSAAEVASVQNGSTINAKNVKISGSKRAQVVASAVNADNIEIVGSDVWTNNSNLKAKNAIDVKATTGYILAEDTSVEAPKVTFDAATDVKGKIDTKESQTNIKAGNDIDVTLANVGNKDKGLVAEAGKNVKIKTDGTLSVSKLVAKDGDMEITADKVVAGLPYTTESKIPSDNSERSYISVKNGTFTSNTANDKYEVSASDTLTADGKFNQRHHIEYGNGSEKILLMTNKPYVAPPVVEPKPPVVEDDNTLAVDDEQAAMVHKLPRQPQTMSNVTNVADTRTTFVDVFAAASQIEIVEDEEE